MTDFTFFIKRAANIQTGKEIGYRKRASSINNRQEASLSIKQIFRQEASLSKYSDRKRASSINKTLA